MWLRLHTHTTITPLFDIFKDNLIIKNIVAIGNQLKKISGPNSGPISSCIDLASGSLILLFLVFQITLESIVITLGLMIG